jgi:hypothetical protein
VAKLLTKFRIERDEYADDYNFIEKDKKNKKKQIKMKRKMKYSEEDSFYDSFNQKENYRK